MSAPETAGGAGPNYPAAILAGGLAAGALDFIAACLVSKAPPLAVAKFIAGGWLGREAARDGGLGAAALGLASHFAILLVAAAVYVVAGRQIPILLRRPGASGMIYGLIVYVVMNYVVLPLSAVGPPTPPSPEALVQGLLIHMILVGLPIAVAARHFAGPQRAAAAA